MAIAKSLVDKFTNSSGLVIETGRWTSTGGSTTATLTTDQGPHVGPNSSPSIVKILWAYFTSDGNHAVALNNDPTTIHPDQVKITVTANDLGGYTFVGKGA